MARPTLNKPKKNNRSKDTYKCCRVCRENKVAQNYKEHLRCMHPEEDPEDETPSKGKITKIYNTNPSQETIAVVTIIRHLSPISVSSSIAVSQSSSLPSSWSP